MAVVMATAAPDWGTSNTAFFSKCVGLNALLYILIALALNCDLSKGLRQYKHAHVPWHWEGF